LEAGELFKGVGGAEGAIGLLEFLGEGVPFDGIEVAAVVEGLFQGDGFVLEMVDVDRGKGVELAGAGEAGGFAQFANLGEPGGVLEGEIHYPVFTLNITEK
jgi:hypothetical protein